MEMTMFRIRGKYNVNTVSQGTIVLYRGFTYTFDLSSSTLAIHPFKIGTSSEGNEYTSGMSTTGSMLTFTVPLDAPDSLYYYCDVHMNMGGSITIKAWDRLVEHQPLFGGCEDQPDRPHPNLDDGGQGNRLPQCQILTF